MTCCMSRLPDEILANVFEFEVSRRKWRLVCKKFSRCVPLNVVVAKSLNAKQEARILDMLGNCNCRTLTTTDWRIDAPAVATKLQANRSLRAISIHHSGIGAGDVMRVAVASLQHDSIQSWSFGDFNLEDDHLAVLATVVQTSRRLRHLQLYQCTCADLGLSALAKALAQTKSLQSMSMRSCTLCPAGLEALARGVSASLTLQSLDLAFTPLGPDGLRAVGACLAQAPGLRHLNLDFANVREGVGALMAGVARSRTLTHLSLRGNGLGDEGAAALAAVLPKSALRVLNVADNGIARAGARALGAALAAARTLRELHLSGNGLGPCGTKALAEGVGRAPALSTVMIAGSSIGRDGVHWLAKALRATRTLTALDLSHNLLSIEGVEDLKEGLQACATLRDLNMEGCGLGPESLALLAPEFSGLTALNLGSCDADVAGLAAVADAVAASASLQTLIIRNAAMSVAGARALARAVGASRALRHLDLQGCGIATEGVQALGHAVAGAARLETLNLVQNGVGAAGAVALADGISRAVAFQSLQVQYSSVTPQGSAALVEAMQNSRSFNDLHLAGPDLCTGGGVQTSVAVRPTVTECDVEVIKTHPFTCSRCSHKLYDYNPDLHKVLAYCVDRAGIIQSVMTPEEWDRFAAGAATGLSPAAELSGRALTAFMEHRVAGFYHTLLSLIWAGDLCHTQFQWYCDSPDTRREMVTLVYRFGGFLVLTNITVSENPHQVPVSFMAGNINSLLWRCPFCGWECCNGGDWMEPEEFYMWLITEWPALMRDSAYYPVVCEECLNEWAQRHNHPDLREALKRLQHPDATTA